VQHVREMTKKYTGHIVTPGTSQEQSVGERVTEAGKASIQHQVCVKWDSCWSDVSCVLHPSEH